MYILYYVVLFVNVLFCNCQSSTLIIDVVEVSSTENATFVCTVSSSTNLKRWTYLSGSTGTSLMSFQNGVCTVSPSDSFLTDRSRYSYKCNSTVYQVTAHPSTDESFNNHILACRDAIQLNGSGSTWMIKHVQDGGTCSYCEPTMTFDVMDVNERDNVTFVCRVSSDETYVNWNKNIGSNVAGMGVQNGKCNTSPGTTLLDNTSEYIYTCNNTVYQVTKLNAQRSEHNDMYMCTPPSQQEGKGSNWIIKVKAPVKSVTMTPAGNKVDVLENTAVEFTCTTSTSRPSASVYWYIHPNGNSYNKTQIIENITTTTDYNDFSVITSTLRFVPGRQHNNMQCFCVANNSVNTSPVMSIKKLLNILYKADDPYIIQGSEYRVIENNPGTLSCSVRGGNPAPTLSWSCINVSPTNQSTIKSNGKVTTTLTWTALSYHDGTCTCTSQQTKFQNQTINVSLVVLYPPSQPVLKVNGSNVVGDISFIEGTTRSIECTSDSKPSPDRYTWTGPSITDSVNMKTLTFNIIEKNEAGQYKCSVHNSMNPSGGVNVLGVNTTDVNVVVLYPPVVAPANNISILQGEELNVSCPYRPGIPSKTSIRWTRNIDDKQWAGERLLLSSIKKNEAGYYSCDASNVMRPSGDNTSYIGKSSQTFYLDVLYAASVTSFIVEGFPNQTVTVNESDRVPFTCIADSNPTAVTTLSVESKMIKNVSSNNLKYTTAKASCLDAGIYVCYAKNTYSGEENVQKEVQLFVNCYPRATGVIDTNITSEKNNTITIVFNVIAYPPPTFNWRQLLNETWTDLTYDDNFDIQSSNHQSNLTIRKVGVDDYTSYKVIVENDVDKMEQHYALSQYDKPDPPTGFRHIESRTTTTSIHLEWKPGFDNGPSQTFYIKYKMSSDTRWNYINVPDNGEQTMEQSLTGLIENTQYVIVIVASNEMGNSSESSVLVTTTKAISGITVSQSMGPLIGGVTGGTVGLVIIIALVVFVGRRNSYINDCFGKLRKSDGIKNSADDHAYYNVGRLDATAANQGSDDTRSNRPKSDANGINHTTEEAAYYNVESVSVPTYEMINRNYMDSTPYSTLQQTEQGRTSDVTSGDKKEIYENLKIQVF